MRRLLITLGIVGICCSTAATANAGWTDFWLRFNVDCHRQKCWPEPFSSVDRQAAAAPFMVMKDKGWQMQNTLGDVFFDVESQHLTRAGKLKVRSILRDSPMHRRSVFVLRGDSAEISSIRLDAVQQTVAHLAQEGPLPPVMLTSSAPRGGSGDYFDQIDRNYRSAMPAPKLPEMSSDGEQ